MHSLDTLQTVAQIAVFWNGSSGLLSPPVQRRLRTDYGTEEL